MVTFTPTGPIPGTRDEGFEPAKPRPPLPGFEPPDNRGNEGREELPAKEAKPKLQVTPLPGEAKPDVEVLPELADEFKRALILEHRGDWYTQRGNDIAVQVFMEQLQRWFPDADIKSRFDHIAGATEYGLGEKKLKENAVGQTGAKGFSMPDGSIFDSERNAYIHFNTGNVLRRGDKLIAPERRQLARLKENLKNKAHDIAIGLPKLRKKMDEGEYRERVQRWIDRQLTENWGKPPQK